MDYSDNPILQDLLDQSRRQDQQVAILGHEVQAYVIQDLPPPPWIHKNMGSGVGCGGCGADPDWEVLVHQVGSCNDAGLDEDGNMVWRGCDACYRRWTREILTILMRLKRYLPVTCPGCGRPIARISDIMLRTRRLHLDNPN